MIKTISVYVEANNNNKLNNAICEQTLIPAYILNAEVFEWWDLILNA